MDSCKFCPFKNFSGPVLTGSQGGHFILFCIQLFQERLSEKVHATIPKGIVGDFSSLFLKEISKNCTRSHGRMFFLSAEGKQLK